MGLGRGSEASQRDDSLKSAELSCQLRFSFTSNQMLKIAA